VSRRASIAFTPEERERFLREAKTIVLCSIDRNGYPHAVAMWFDVDPDGSVLMTTYGKSQKVLNLKRDPKVTLLAESGTTYDQLRGVMIRGRAEVIEDVERCAALLERIHVKMGGESLPGLRDALRERARKRVLLRIVPQRTSSWDHSKLGGAY
jgi:PPOX class probable F420-dependent enzyme